MATYNQILSKTQEFINKYDDFLVVAHDKPDGDTIASSIALYLFLKKINKRVQLVCKSEVPQVFAFLKQSSEFKYDFFIGDYQAVILVDNGDLKRTGFSARLKEIAHKKPILNIDHHPQNDIWKIAKVNLVNTKASSTAEIIYDLLRFVNPFLIKNDIATAILTGIYTDTGGFMHPTTTSKILALSSHLLSLGARLKTISENLSGHRDFTTLKLWGLVLKNIRVNNELGIIASVISQDEIQRTGATEDDLAGVVNMMNTVPGARVVLLLYETKDGNIRGSFRTDSDKIDVSSLAEMLGGGGHKRASGFSLSGKLMKKEGKVEIV